MSTPSIATALWSVAPGRAELRDEPLPEPKAGQVRVRMVRSGISRGTEALVLHGRVPDSQVEAMRGPHQQGEFPFAVKYGYMAVGVVENGDLTGKLVHCLHPHQDRFVVDRSAVVPVPEGVPARRAVLAANMETALNGVWDARPGPGDRICVVGGGVVGCLVAWLLGQIPGTQVVLVDTLAGRAGTAAALGVSFELPEDAPPNCDLVVHTSGAPAGLRTALAAAGTEATVLEMSWYGDRPVPVMLGEAFHSRRLVLRSSQVGRIPAHRTARWSYRRRMGVALKLLEDDALDVLLDGQTPFSRLPARLAEICDKPGVLCHSVVYPHADVGP